MDIIILYNSFLAIILFFSLLIIFSNNPVYSVFFLVLVFFGAAGVFFILNIEFVPLIFIVVYVGAIAILFLFVVMMLNIKIIKRATNLLSYIPFILLFALFFILIFDSWFIHYLDTFLIKEEQFVMFAFKGSPENHKEGCICFYCLGACCLELDKLSIFNRSDLLINNFLAVQKIEAGLDHIPLKLTLDDLKRNAYYYDGIIEYKGQIPYNRITYYRILNGIAFQYFTKKRYIFLLDTVEELDLSSNISFQNFGKFLFTNYYTFIVLAGLILLVAMIGSIVLTLDQKMNVKRQQIFLQLRDKMKANIKKN